MNLKRLSILVVLALFMFAGVCFAEIIGNYELVAIEDDTCILWKYNGHSSANLTIPDSFTLLGRDTPVSAIEDEAFSRHTELTRVVIPEGVTSIGYRAFYNCRELTQVVLPSTIQYISDEAFAGCIRLTQINLPDSLFYAGENIFKGCESLNLNRAQNDALTYTDVAAMEQQQANFVTDTNNLVELTPCLGTSIRKYIAQHKDMSNCHATSGIEYGNDFYLVGSSGEETHNDAIDFIDLFAKCNYSIFGVYCDMDLQTALGRLMDKGWNVNRKIIQMYELNDGAGNYIHLHTENNSTVSEISIWMDRDNALAIYSGRVQGYGSNSASKNKPENNSMPSVSKNKPENNSMPSVSKSKPENNSMPSAPKSYARTTGNVNMRTGPGLNYDSICAIPSGTTLEFLKQISVDNRGVTWYYVRYNGQKGWCSSKYVTLT